MYSRGPWLFGIAVTEDLYRIGAVAKRTGITPECLRAWERRYGLTPADRAGKTRFYDSSQVERLTRIKALLDQGHPISQVIHLPTDALDRRLAPRRTPRLRTEPRVALIGGALVRAYREAEKRHFEAVAEWASVADLLREAVPSKLDCVVAYLPSLDPEEIERIEEFCEVDRVVVVFKYATAADLAECRAAALPMLRWPAEWRRVEELVVAGMASDIDDAARRFSNEELLHISQVVLKAETSPAGCECPHHLAMLIGELNDYAVHARRCGADDRHDDIERDVAMARAHLERALQGQVDAHGLLVTAN